MKVKVTNQDGWKRVLEIEVPPEEVQIQLDKAFQKIQKQAKIPGFRPGKVPLDMVKARFKDAAQEESFEEILNSSYRQALEETKLEPVAMPKVSDLDYQPGTSLKYKAEIEIHPQIEAKNYKKLKLTRKVLPVEDKLVDDTLNHLRERNAELVPVEREAKENDYVVADLEEISKENGQPVTKKFENQLLELDPQALLKEFQAALVGVKSGEERNFSVDYPKDYANTRLAGKKIEYRLRVKEIKQKNLPELNDAFAKAQGEVQTLLELKLKIRESLEKRQKEESQKELKAQVADTLLQKNPFTIPETLLNSYLDLVVSDFKKRYPEMDENQVREKNKKPGEDRLRWEYLYRQIARQENVSVTEAEIQERVKNFAAAYNLPLDKAQEYLSQSKQIKDIAESIIEDKVFDLILNQAEIKEERIKSQ